MTIVFTGAAMPRTPAGLAHAAAVIGCELAALQAVLSVEASGDGFDKLKRPKALFEPHIFYRLLALAPAKLKAAVAAGLAYPKWGMKPYPADSYPRIAAAIAIDETAALEAASWGLGQVLGENCAKAGYASPQAMVAAFVASEDAQLAGMASFIVHCGLAVDLRFKSWSTFARGYNGAGYAKNHYDTKLAIAYRTAKARAA
ncbi:Protein of unknown function [Rhizobiales bacterium GAS188]|nr:Protein of unknown function [Rhizobiales bacterium GAS188]